MAYTAFDSTKPVGTQTGTAFATSTRANILALRDAIAAMGSVQGFNYSYTTGTADQPTTILFKRSTEWIKLVLTWGTTGGEAGNVTKAAYYYSSNSGGAYDGMADAAGYYVMTLTYDSNGNLTATTWGSTP